MNENFKILESIILPEGSEEDKARHRIKTNYNMALESSKLCNGNMALKCVGLVFRDSEKLEKRFSETFIWKEKMRDSINNIRDDMINKVSENLNHEV